MDFFLEVVLDSGGSLVSENMGPRSGSERIDKIQLRSGLSGDFSKYQGNSQLFFPNPPYQNTAEFHIELNFPLASEYTIAL